MYNEIFEIQVQLYLKENIELKNSYEKIGTLINFSMNENDFLKQLHTKKGKYKEYCLSGMYPIEQEKIYKQGEVYNILIRSYKHNIIKNLHSCLKDLENDNFIIINVNDIKRYKKSNIDYIDTITPTIVTKDNRCWNYLKDSKEYFDKAIFNNLVKKYNYLQGINQIFNYEDVIDEINIRNKYAIIINYKGVKFLGYKIRVYFKDNNIAQEFANLSIAEGVGEKNSSFGQGFVKPYFRKR
ncbi:MULTISPECIES: CRISPR-associated endoribonuclease Cas6 [unclassified Clostridium]|uniref:CRISPR-associated endoribonuclease Cas6 n=1 Tax=unclassified Clostridium TaxID=2614128 RepID=UPI002079808A|nr:MULTISPECIES: CRISPR-associated endoribonuclease Cas6 [unclassified Clostridium]